MSAPCSSRKLARTGPRSPAVEYHARHWPIRQAPVGFINIAQGDPAAIDRLNRYRAAVESAGLPFDESLVIHTGIHAGGSADCPGKGDGNAVDGYKAARVLFRRHPHLSLLFCDTDRMAMGAYDYLKETGRRIPQDVAVVGFDNQWLVATQIRPTLTTIAFPHYEMGKRAVQLTLATLTMRQIQSR